MGVTLTITDATTIGGSDGSVSITGTGGTPAYSYIWNNGPTTATNSNITTRTYSVTITDTKGCLIVDSALVSDPAAVVLVLESSKVSCFAAADGTAKVIAPAGSGSFTYLWVTWQRQTQLAAYLQELTL